jgi:hypothetical protein
MIERGIRIPPEEQKRELHEDIPELLQMEVGDSILIPIRFPEDRIRLTIELASWGIDHKRGHRIKQQPGAKAVRIWRVPYDTVKKE